MANKYIFLYGCASGYTGSPHSFIIFKHKFHCKFNFTGYLRGSFFRLPYAYTQPFLKYSKFFLTIFGFVQNTC